MTMSFTRCPVHGTARRKASPLGTTRTLSCAPTASGVATTSVATPLISARRVRRIESRLLAHAALQLFELARCVCLVVRAGARTRDTVDLFAQRFALRRARATELGLELVHRRVDGGRSTPFVPNRNPTRRRTQLFHHLIDVALGESELVLLRV